MWNAELYVAFTASTKRVIKFLFLLNLIMYFYVRSKMRINCFFFKQRPSQSDVTLGGLILFMLFLKIGSYQNWKIQGVWNLTSQFCYKQKRNKKTAHNHKWDKVQSILLTEYFLRISETWLMMSLTIFYSENYFLHGILKNKCPK